MMDLRGGEAAERMCLFNRKLVSQPGSEVWMCSASFFGFMKNLLDPTMFFVKI